MLCVPQPVREILAALQRGGYAAYAVGGCVRDSLLGRPVHDWDICTAALPGEMPACFPGEKLLPTGVRHGTMTLLRQGRAYEITSFRCDGNYTDHRRPDTVRFVRDLESDLARRDFTVNAMACNGEGELFDPFGGQQDLQRLCLRCVGDPMRRMEEDALRILRGMRFAAAYGFIPEPATARAMLARRETLRFVSAERILQELRRLLVAPGAGEVLSAFYPVARVIIPELPAAFDAAAFARGPGEEAWRFALLLFPLGAEQSGAVLRRLRAENALRQRVGEMLALAVLPLPENTAELRRQAARFGPVALRGALQLRAARGEEVAPFLAELDVLEAAHACLCIKDLAVGGKDLLALGFAGKAVGEAQRMLLSAVLEGCPNERAVLLSLAAEFEKGETLP